MFLAFFVVAHTHSLKSGNKKVTCERPKVGRYLPFTCQSVVPCILRVSGGWDGGREENGRFMLPPNNFDEPTTVLIFDDFKGGGRGDISISSDVSVMMLQVLSWYTNVLAAHPLVTQMATSALLGALGDWICQRLASKTAVFTCDYRRLCVFSLVNGLFLATVIHKWFHFLESMPVLKGMPEQRAIWMVD